MNTVRPDWPGELSAFPHPENRDWMFCGLTKRELLAAMAMQGALGGVPGSHLRPDILSRDSVAHAEALLAELAKEPRT